MSMSFNGHTIECTCGNTDSFSISGADSRDGDAQCLKCSASITIPAAGA